MRANADVIVLQLVLQLLCWRWAGVRAGGGALDAGASFHQTTSPAPATAKLASFSASLSDGLAKAVAHEGRDRKHDFFLLLFWPTSRALLIVAVRESAGWIED